MYGPVAAKPHLLVIEDDRDIQQALHLLLADAGYDVTVASSLAEALAFLDSTTFQLIITDSFAQTPDTIVSSLQMLLERAHPTPVGILTAWQFAEEDAEPAGFAFLATKPYDLDQLLALVAGALETPLTPEQEHQALTVRRYFAELTARDWDGFVELCTDDVTYVLPGNTPFSGTIVGKAAFRKYTDETFSVFPEAHFERVQIYSSPTGLAARFEGWWRAPDGSTPHMSGGTHFQFAGDHIKQIGVKLNDERLRALMSPTS
ncbi:MAG: nuclear transport factor 2 family protein [Ktedonobacterales bacterium]